MKTTTIAIFAFGALLVAPSFGGEEEDVLVEDLKDVLDPLLKREYSEEGVEWAAQAAKIRDTCRVIPIQLDADAQIEVVVWVGFMSGNHHNSIMFVFDRVNDGWRSLGMLLGSHPKALATQTQGLRNIQTWWHAGSGEGVVTTYTFDGKAFVKSTSERTMLKGH